MRGYYTPMVLFLLWRRARSSNTISGRGLMKRVLHSLIFSCLAALLVAQFSCAGTNHGVAPAPPAELPTVLSFPASVGMDMSEIQSASLSISAPSPAKSYSASDVAGVIGAGGDIIGAIVGRESFADVVLAVFDNVEIPTN